MIEVKIPYGLNNTLADAYNKAMGSSYTEWTLLLDHDVYLALNPHWYEMCCDAIQKVDETVGMLTAVTWERNGFDITWFEKTDDLNEQEKIANAVWKLHGDELVSVKNHKRPGFFMLVRRSAWEKIGGFNDQGKGVEKIDHDFCQRLLEAGFDIKVINGLYVYHKKGVKKVSWK